MNEIDIFMATVTKIFPMKLRTKYLQLGFIVMGNFLLSTILIKSLRITTLPNMVAILIWWILCTVILNLVYILDGGIYRVELICYDKVRKTIYILHQGCYPKKKLNVRFYGVNWYLAETYERDQYHIKRTKKKTYISLGATSFRTEITISKARDKLIFGDRAENDQK